MYTVYKIFENETRKVVKVGRTNDLWRRINQHFKQKTGKFYGMQDTHTIQVIEEVSTLLLANKREEYWQKFYELETDLEKKKYGGLATTDFLDSLTHNEKESYLKSKASKGVNTFFSKGEDHVSSWKSQISETLKNKQPFACACGKMLKAQGRHKCK